MEIFRDDDAGYRTWIYANPTGYVVNAERRPTPGYLVLHTAMCDTITPAPDQAWLGTASSSAPYAGSSSTNGRDRWAGVLPSARFASRSGHCSASPHIREG
jgi:hypothetical protein